MSRISSSRIAAALLVAGAATAAIVTATGGGGPGPQGLRPLVHKLVYQASFGNDATCRRGLKTKPCLSLTQACAIARRPNVFIYKIGQTPPRVSYRTACAAVGGPVGVAFMSTTAPAGDSGANCRNYGTPPLSYPAANTVCYTLGKVNQLLARGETGEMYGGTYAVAQIQAPSTAMTDARSCSDQTNNAVIQPRGTDTVVFSPGTFVRDNTHCLTIDGKNRMNTGSAGLWSSNAAYPNEPVIFAMSDGLGGNGGTYNTFENAQLSTINGVSDHLSVLNMNLGPCAQPTQVQINAYFAHTPTPYICSDQEIGTAEDWTGNGLHDMVCLSQTDIPTSDATQMQALSANSDWCNPPASGNLTGSTCQVTPPCTFYSNGYHSEVEFIRGCLNCIFSRNFAYGSNSVDVRIQNTGGTNPITNVTFTNNLLDHPTCNAAGTCLSDTQAVQIDTPIIGGYFGFNSIPDLCDYPTSAPGSGKCDTLGFIGTSGSPITAIGNLMGESSCNTGSDFTNYTYNGIENFSMFSSLGNCGSATNSMLGYVNGGAFKYVTDAHRTSWDAHLQGSSPGKNLVPGPSCPATDLYGMARPTGVGTFCNAGAVQ